MAPFFQSRTALYALLALLTVTVFSGQQVLPPMDRDEARFAQASRQMLQSGDYVTIRFQDELRAKKPAGIHWLQVAAASVLGENHIGSYRFVNLLALISSVFILYHIGLSFCKSHVALAASAAFSTSLLVFAEAHLAKTDTVLMMLILIQQWALMQSYLNRDDANQKSSTKWLWFWGAMAAGILVKGPVAPTIAALTILSLFLWHRNANFIKYLRFRRGILLVAIICLPWAILVSLATEGAFLDIALTEDFLAKVTSGQESHGAPPLTYLALFGFLMWPASVLFPTALVHLRPMLANDSTRFLLAWIIPYWIAIEFMPTKLPHYPLPVMPALALLLLWSASRAIKLQTFSHRLIITSHYFLLAFGPVLLVAIIWVGVMFGGENSPVVFGFTIVAALFVGLAIWHGHAWIQTRLWYHLFIMFGTALMFHFTVFTGVAPNLARVHVSVAVADSLEQSGSWPTTIAAAGYHEPSLVFHLGQDVLLIGGREAALFLAETLDGVALIEVQKQQEFLDMAHHLGIVLAKPQQVAGFNISKGEDVIILIYKREIFDGTSGNG